ncbi:hypothetical protein MLD38_030071 [Melastoma candidum]|uniref:Uncharacterized protein n=1 Tax=Melastoma candidum TaxID=119954 RepID=A0ACB9MK75_9MYRT|nr:hypothetical protein MLD38_030071 [Melastoma candidum]
MGRVFIVEFDDFDDGKFYVCQGCSTPFAKNTDIYHYWKGPGDLVPEIILFSEARKTSNLVDSEVTHAARDRQELHCVACNNRVGIKFTRPDPQEPFVFYSLNSKRLQFRMSGIENDHDVFAPDEWFDPPRPPGDWLS